MATSGCKKGVSVQTYRYNERLAIRLEYDRGEQRQSVFLNGELRSAFLCPVGCEATHTFRGHDAMSAERGSVSEWRVRFGVEQNSFRIRYEICRRNTDGDDTKWYWWDRNTEPEEWSRFPECDEEGQVQVCGECGTNLTCPECTGPEWGECAKCYTEMVCPECDPPQPREECAECGGPLHCEACDSGEREPKLVHDVARMQEELQAIEPSRLQAALVEAIGRQEDSETGWATVIEQVLNESGCDISTVRLPVVGDDGDDDDDAK